MAESGTNYIVLQNANLKELENILKRISFINVLDFLFFKIQFLFTIKIRIIMFFVVIPASFALKKFSKLKFYSIFLNYN